MCVWLARENSILTPRWLINTLFEAKKTSGKIGFEIINSLVKIPLQLKGERSPESEREKITVVNQLTNC